LGSQDIQCGKIRQEKILGILYLLFSSKTEQNQKLCFRGSLKSSLQVNDFSNFSTKNRLKKEDSQKLCNIKSLLMKAITHSNSAYLVYELKGFIFLISNVTEILMQVVTTPPVITSSPLSN